MTALSILEREGIAKHHFGVYCGDTGVPLATYDSLEELPQQFQCDVCDKEHCVADRTCKVEVYFTVDHEQLSHFESRASAA